MVQEEPFFSVSVMYNKRVLINLGDKFEQIIRKQNLTAKLLPGGKVKYLFFLIRIFLLSIFVTSTDNTIEKYQTINKTFNNRTILYF